MSKALARNDQLLLPSKLQLDEDDIRAINYYRDELEDTLKRFDTFREKVNDIIEKGKQQEYVIEFRKMLSGHCITHNRTITIIQCTTIIKNGHCKFNEECKVRRNILEYIEL